MRQIKKISIIIFLFISLPQCGISPSKKESASMNPETNAYTFSFTSINNTPLHLAQFKGNVLLVVNTASQCRFTPQYKELEELFNTYKDRGLVVLGVPSNDFGNQEPGTAQEISCFLKDHYPTTFPVTEKEIVRGKNAHPFYTWVAKKAGFLGKPRWNFQKYLINKKGELVDWFLPTTSPLSRKVIRLIEKLLQD